MISAHALAKILISCDIPVKGISEPNDLEDGSIDITDRIHVQVGESYMCVNFVERNGIIMMGDVTSSIESIINQVRARLYN